MRNIVSYVLESEFVKEMLGEVIKSVMKDQYSEMFEEMTGKTPVLPMV